YGRATDTGDTVAVAGRATDTAVAVSRRQVYDHSRSCACLRIDVYPSPVVGDYLVDDREAEAGAVGFVGEGFEEVFEIAAGHAAAGVGEDDEHAAVGQVFESDRDEAAVGHCLDRVAKQIPADLFELRFADDCTQRFRRRTVIEAV